MTSIRICVLGGRGFVGSAITTGLRERGHPVITMDPHIGGNDHLSLDILDENLQDHLNGFDVVINLVGLSPMKRPGVPGYHDIHVAGAENVVGACEINDVDRLIHMSALGADASSEMTFLKTKGLGEQAVKQANLDTTILRPSVIFDHGNELVEYAKRFAPLRLFPHISTRVQPIYRGDIATLFADAAAGRIDEPVLDVAGPHQLSLYRFVKKLYNARGYSCHPVPGIPLMKRGLKCMQYVPNAPFGKEQARFLTVDNVTETNAAERYVNLLSYDAWLEQEF